MKILDQVPELLDFTDDQAEKLFFPLNNLLIDHLHSKLNQNNNAILFSGNFRLPYNCLYLEEKMLSHTTLKWRQDTIFVDQSNESLIKYILKKHNCDCIAILHSNTFVGYQNYKNILLKIKKLKELVNQVIVTLPIHSLDFNRLKYSYYDIANKLEGYIFDDSFVICQ